MNEICTSIEQSKKLLELGIDVNTSDMYWSLVNKNHPPIIGNYCAEYGGMQLPAWSLNALLDMIPNRYALDKVNNEYFITHTLGGKQERFDNPLDAAFEMICWLKENSKI